MNVTWNQNLYDSVAAIFAGECGSALERYSVQRFKLFDVTMTRTPNRRMTFAQLSDLFGGVNASRFGLSAVCRKIVYLPTGETMFEIQEEV